MIARQPDRCLGRDGFKPVTDATPVCYANKHDSNARALQSFFFEKYQSVYSYPSLDLVSAAWAV
jgi:hypothetical protein